MFTDEIKGSWEVESSWCRGLKKQTLKRYRRGVDNTAAPFPSQLRASDFYEDAVESSGLRVRLCILLGSLSVS